MFKRTLPLMVQLMPIHISQPIGVGVNDCYELRSTQYSSLFTCFFRIDILEYLPSVLSPRGRIRNTPTFLSTISFS
ncbi:hypothetical protein BDV59DRAFT_170351 [Aspergillus ambiguus]|uniref:uncharacterized protein n=1 Tax=Aspergillus ambiguus TaxID=176160 RepID=UPI003CCD92FD